MTRISFLAIFTAQIFENCFSISRRKNYNTNFIQNRELTKKTRVWPTLLLSNSGPNAVNAELFLEDMISMRTDLNPIVNMFNFN